MLRNASIAFVAAVLLLSAGCAKRTRARTGTTSARAVKPATIGDTEEGIASWYGNPYHGRRAASGEIFDMEQLTAAHRTLPFQTWVQVTNLNNGKQVDVRITDRGPFVDDRIIDLSLAAAREIDMVRAGISKVRLRVIDAPKDAPKPVVSSLRFAVQAGAFADQARAIAIRDSLQFPDARLVELDGERKLWRVLVGRSLEEKDAEQLAKEVKNVMGEAMVVRDPENTD